MATKTAFKPKTQPVKISPGPASGKIILGFVGPIASGKGSVCTYLREKHHAGYHRFSSILRDILKRVYLSETRENMQLISTVLRHNFGDDLLALAITNDVKNDPSQIVCVDGVRRLPDIKHLLNLPDFYLVSVDADERIRYERIVKRRENPDDAHKTFEQFLDDNKREAERQIQEVVTRAHFTINNNAGYLEMYQQIEDILMQIRNK